MAAAVWLLALVCATPTGGPEVVTFAASAKPEALVQAQGSGDSAYEPPIPDVTADATQIITSIETGIDGDGLRSIPDLDSDKSETIAKRQEQVDDMVVKGTELKDNERGVVDATSVTRVNNNETRKAVAESEAMVAKMEKKSTAHSYETMQYAKSDIASQDKVFKEHERIVGDVFARDAKEFDEVYTSAADREVKDFDEVAQVYNKESQLVNLALKDVGAKQKILSEHLNTITVKQQANWEKADVDAAAVATLVANTDPAMQAVFNPARAEIDAIPRGNAVINPSSSNEMFQQARDGLNASIDEAKANVSAKFEEIMNGGAAHLVKTKEQADEHAIVVANQIGQVGFADAAEIAENVKRDLALQNMTAVLADKVRSTQAVNTATGIAQKTTFGGTTREHLKNIADMESARQEELAKWVLEQKDQVVEAVIQANSSIQQNIVNSSLDASNATAVGQTSMESAAIDMQDLARNADANVSVELIDAARFAGEAAQDEKVAKETLKTEGTAKKEELHSMWSEDSKEVRQEVDSELMKETKKVTQQERESGANITELSDFLNRQVKVLENGDIWESLSKAQQVIYKDFLQIFEPVEFDLTHLEERLQHVDQLVGDSGLGPVGKEILKFVDVTEKSLSQQTSEANLLEGKVDRMVPEGTRDVLRTINEAKQSASLAAMKMNGDTQGDVDNYKNQFLGLLKRSIAGLADVKHQQSFDKNQWQTTLKYLFSEEGKARVGLDDEEEVAGQYGTVLEEEARNGVPQRIGGYLKAAAATSASTKQEIDALFDAASGTSNKNFNEARAGLNEQSAAMAAALRRKILGMINSTTSTMADFEDAAHNISQEALKKSFQTTKSAVNGDAAMQGAIRAVSESGAVLARDADDRKASVERSEDLIIAEQDKLGEGLREEFREVAKNATNKFRGQKKALQDFAKEGFKEIEDSMPTGDAAADALKRKVGAVKNDAAAAAGNASIASAAGEREFNALKEGADEELEEVNEEVGAAEGQVEQDSAAEEDMLAANEKDDEDVLREMGKAKGDISEQVRNQIKQLISEVETATTTISEEQRAAFQTPKLNLEEIKSKFDASDKETNTQASAFGKMLSTEGVELQGMVDYSNSSRGGLAWAIQKEKAVSYATGKNIDAFQRESYAKELETIDKIVVSMQSVSSASKEKFRKMRAQIVDMRKDSSSMVDSEEFALLQQVAKADEYVREASEGTDKTVKYAADYLETSKPWLADVIDELELAHAEQASSSNSSRRKEKEDQQKADHDSAVLGNQLIAGAQGAVGGSNLPINEMGNLMNSMVSMEADERGPDRVEEMRRMMQKSLDFTKMRRAYDQSMTQVGRLESTTEKREEQLEAVLAALDAIDGAKAEEVEEKAKQLTQRVLNNALPGGDDDGSADADDDAALAAVKAKLGGPGGPYDKAEKAMKLLENPEPPVPDLASGNWSSSEGGESFLQVHSSALSATAATLRSALAQTAKLRTLHAALDRRHQELGAKVHAAAVHLRITA